MLIEMCQGLGKRTAHDLFMQLRYFAANGHGAFFTKDFNELLQSLNHTMWRLIEYHRASFLSQLCEACLPPLLLRQEPLKAELITGKARGHQRRNKSRSPGQTTHLNACAHSFAHHEKSRVADTWCAGIAYHGNRLPGQQPLHNTCYSLVLIELVVGKHGTVDVKMLQKEAACTCVFCQYQIGFLENTEGAESNVLHIAYGGGYDI